MIGVLGFDFRQRLEIFLFTTASRTALEPTQPPIQWVPGALSRGVKQLGREADHSPPSSVEVKNAWSYTSTHQYVFMAWCLVKHRDNFTFTFNPLCCFSTSVYCVVYFVIDVAQTLLDTTSYTCVRRSTRTNDGYVSFISFDCQNCSFVFDVKINITPQRLSNFLPM
jgi:hypothetical protein